MPSTRLELPTLLLIAACTGVWVITVACWSLLPLWIVLPVLAIATALHSSLQHEALHGHPTRSALVNELLVFPALGLLYPYRRFKSLHLHHHRDATLTDPYDDPESYYLALGDWQRLPAPLKRLLEINNTLAGRLILGPLINTAGFVGSEFRRLLRGERDVAVAWGLHALALAMVAATLRLADFPLWLYLFGVAWPALSLILLRTFAEHQASEIPGQRTVIVESGAFFSLLFLNNNLHFVHHDSPRTPWYLLPRRYRERRREYRQANGFYGYDGYFTLARRFLLRAKGPVPHPILKREQ